MDQAERKREAARAALEAVSDGARLGIGTGSTAEAFVRLLGARIADGLSVIGVPTSQRTAALCAEHAVPLTTLDETPELDLTVDGADEIGPGLALVKGGGGALLREKIVAAASRAMIVIADDSKLVDTLGAYPLPIEVTPFGLGATRLAIARTGEALGLAGTLALRMAGGAPFETDGGHFILDASFGRIPDPRALAEALNAIPGVMEHGLFLGLADRAIVAGANGIRTIEATR
ncbi:ribose-5-phosphate isomerase RpiA [Aquibium sp. A9E412]|uniref:ribose-5-phosphate isomerase RpiA n=1 Tax=Aquibium sp. A9E412 TaxID=2976767 RepID=UPI0025B076FB|nr:ribose-5-phosphate isomerase RpiA [Aquibium sp. A9E412]MDN2567680.1 ribose-5-phosphate isomerase RpiA [Aquibium sp. A9E412]